MIEIPFIGGAYEHNSLSLSAQRCVNLYPEIIESTGGKSQTILLGTPGLSEFCDMLGGNVRGLYKASNGSLFGVSGNVLNKISTNGTVTSIGTINSFNGVVRMSDNGIQLIIVDADNRKGYIHVLGSASLSLISDADYPEGTHVAYINSRFIINKPDSELIYYSDLNDGTSWSALQAFTAEGSPDYVQGLIAIGGQLFVLGTDSYQWFYDSGNGYTAISGSFKDIGCAAPDSIAKYNENLFWVSGNNSGNGTIYMSDGYQARRISTNAIDKAIQESTVTDADAFCYQQNGHEIYQVTFPSSQQTWCYDLSTGLWHEKNYTDSANNTLAHRAQWQAFFNGFNLVGDRRSGKIFKLDQDAYTDDGEAIHRMRVSPHIWNSMDRVYYSTFQLDMEVGVGLNGSSTNLTGLINATDSSTTVTGNYTTLTGTITTDLTVSVIGSGCDFTGELSVGDSIRWVDDASVVKYGVVNTITDPDNLSLVTASDSVTTDLPIYKQNTLFLTELAANDDIEWIDDSGNSRSGVVSSIQNNGLLTLQETATGTATNVTGRLMDFSGVDPHVMLDWSEDGGKTYGNVYNEPIGKQGEYSTRVIWNRLGADRNRVFRVKITDPIKVTLIGAWIDTE